MRGVLFILEYHESLRLEINSKLFSYERKRVLKHDKEIVGLCLPLAWYSCPSFDGDVDHAVTSFTVCFFGEKTSPQNSTKSRWVVFCLIPVINNNKQVITSLSGDNNKVNRLCSGNQLKNINPNPRNVCTICFISFSVWSSDTFKMWGGGGGQENISSYHATGREEEISGSRKSALENCDTSWDEFIKPVTCGLIPDCP